MLKAGRDKKLEVRWYQRLDGEAWYRRLMMKDEFRASREWRNLYERVIGIRQIVMTDDELERLLENWGRWCRFAKAIGTCESIEKDWRTPQHWDATDPHAPTSDQDRDSALAVNRAWLGMPDLHKRVLRDWYAFRRNPRVTCRLLAIPFAAHGEYLAKARVMCKNLLREGVV